VDKMTSVVQQIVNPPVEKPITVSKHSKTDPSTTIMAAAWFGKRDVRMLQVPKPLVTDPGDAVVKITSTTICGSDLHMYLNKVPGIKPMEKGDILGHEFMGIVESVGPDVQNIKPGDRVVVSAIIACGQCWYCKNGYFSSCDTTNPSSQMEKLYGHRTGGIFGYSQLTGGYDGGQAEYVRVPFANLNCLKVPDNLPDEKVLFLSDVVCTAWHGCELGEVSKGQTVCIWGCGPVGLLCAQWCKVRGASKVACIDDDTYRLEVARKIGAETINFDEANVIETIQRMFPGGPDVCIDCAGYRFPKSMLHQIEQFLKLETDALDIVDEMMRTVKKTGKVVLIGDYFGYANHFPIGAFMEKGLTMRGGQVFVQRYWKDLLGYIERGEFDPTVIVTHTMPLGRCPDAYDMFCYHKDNMIKCVLKTKAGEATMSARP
jgi:threonine dehydrogenase-like Zn-dependent dehydrogenase